MQPYLTSDFYNPSSPYTAARKVRADLQDAKSRLASIVGGRSHEIVLTAGATESINLAIQGTMKLHPDSEIITTPIEHPAVIQTAGQFKHSICRVSETGMIDVESLGSLITDNTVLISIGYANNELGTVQPLKAVAAMILQVRQQRLKDENDLPIYLHSDASQAAGYLDLNVSRLGVDMLTLNAAKCYGPKQTGLLWVKKGTLLQPLVFGGGQEAGLRSGTESVANAVGFATALEIAEKHRKAETDRISGLRDDLKSRLLNEIPSTVVTDHPKRHLPNILHVAWDGIDGERLVYGLDDLGVCVATGSACAANKGTRSHVLEAVGMEPSLADGSLRISLGSPTTEEEVSTAARAIVDTVMKEMK